ncbi:hypothetical protein MUY21_03625 [Aliiroseovarius sp. S2029]|uniref:hypothetical protein n=1 Tax=Aliiroseovarius sp. S2029 TaxID=2936988 RepID=UPI0020C01BFD|nr:hypothetical protein [Aliiroseovarius sp. S2029]MCK8483117.1 hypothetical protein [Aliiroseovarius sp. S2029]
MRFVLPRYPVVAPVCLPSMRRRKQAGFIFLSIKQSRESPFWQEFPSSQAQQGCSDLI